MNQSHEPMRSISRELAAAERRRKSAMKLYISAGGLVLAGLVLVVSALATGGRPDAAPEKQSETVIEDAAITEDPAVDVPAETDAEVVSLTAEGVEEPAAAAPPAPTNEAAAAPRAEAKPALQRVKINIGALGYEPATVEVKAGAPVELTVAKGEGCAAGFALPELGVSADNSNGPAKVRLDALEPGTYKFTCGMAMVEGRLVVS